MKLAHERSVRAVAPVAAALLACAACGTGPGDAVGDDTASPPVPSVVLDTLPVSASQRIAQQTPLAVSAARLYLAVLQPGPDGADEGLELETALFDAPRPAGDDPLPGDPPEWRRTPIDSDSAFDAWHTSPGVGVDPTGRVHVAYNMHNLPWQYVVSEAPDAVDRLEFRGQGVTVEELARMKFENRTNFPTPGEAAIPGNQVTYPAFYNDRDGNLWVTYRFGARPALDFERRAMSAGIARYDAEARTWRALGSPLPRVPGDVEPADATPAPALAGADGWTAYHPRPAFAPDGTLHVSWAWREGIAGEHLERPCHLESRDLETFRTAAGEPVALPAGPDGCGPIVPAEREKGPFLTLGSTAVDDEGRPHVVLSPAGKQREIHAFVDGAWRVEPSPYAAPEILFDARGTLWAFASGPVVHARPKGGDWVKVYESEDKRYCDLRAAPDPDGSRVWLYAPHCDASAVSVLGFDLRVPVPPGG